MEQLAHDEKAVVATLAARLFPGPTAPLVERVTEGMSTRVYRLRCAAGVYYLRVLPEEGAGFAAEALAHRLLRARGVRVPEVIYVEHCHPILQRAVMVTSEVRGGPLLGADVEACSLKCILHEAGRQMALINSVSVRGFGWICRGEDDPQELTGELPSWEAFLHEQVDGPLPRLAAAGVLSQVEVRAVEWAVAHHAGCWQVPQARLAHGDLDASHIYCTSGAYTGIIDLGEIRGTDPYYDLGHFSVEHSAWLPDLLAGYGEVAPLPAGYEEGIRFAGLCVAVNRLGRRLAKQQAIGRDNTDLRFVREVLPPLATS